MSIAVAASSGSSPWTFTTTSAGGSRGSASTIRAVPLGASGDVISTRPPNPLTAAAISSASVTTTTVAARRDADAARQVCSTSVIPVSERSIFRGRRVLESRAGMTMTAERMAGGYGVTRKAESGIGIVTSTTSIRTPGGVRHGRQRSRSGVARTRL